MPITPNEIIGQIRGLVVVLVGGAIGMSLSTQRAMSSRLKLALAIILIVVGMVVAHQTWIPTMMTGLQRTLIRCTSGLCTYSGSVLLLYPLFHRKVARKAELPFTEEQWPPAPSAKGQ